MGGLQGAEELDTPGRLFTWVDVDEHLARLASAGGWPQWLLSADAWWDGVELSVVPGTTPEEVRQWLDQAFGIGSVESNEGELILGLDDPRQSGFTGLPVTLCPDVDPVRPRRLPRLREKHITAELARPLPRPRRDHFADDVQVLAFHSFKGGVGRTVHAVAMADRLAGQGARVLLIDADLEAPGITWMHQAQGGQLDFSYEDLLVLLHGSDDGDVAPAVDIAASYLPNQEAGRYPGTGAVIVLPASRRTTLGPPRIEPADLLTPDRSPNFVTEAMAALAARIGADAVIIDLRAGASELSAPVLLDPRVQRVFVTTLSHQSLFGTIRLIEQLGRGAPTRRGVDPASCVIITQYRKDVHGEQMHEARHLLANALSGSLAAAAGEDVDPIGTDVLTTPTLSPFREELLALPSEWDAVVAVLARCGLPEALEPVSPAVSHTESGEEPAPVDQGERRRMLAATAKRLTFAEQEGLSSATGFLVTDPLRRLLGDHRTGVPLSLVVGAKGAGKTFTYAKACAARTWRGFAQESQIDGVSIEAPIVPVLESDTLQQEGLTTQNLRDDFAATHLTEGGEAATGLAIRDRLLRGFNELEAQDTIGWRTLWLECLAAAAGVFPSGAKDAESALAGLGKRARAIFVVDGLEDLLQSLDSETKRTALRVLLIDVLNWLRALRGQPFGLVIFVRQDLVTWAVRQNSAQLLGRYDAYALHWNYEEALRLALWVAVRSETIDKPATEVANLSYDELVQLLIGLWGWKMGTQKSREARSHLWVPAALADYNEQIQARDVVAFLAEAAELSVSYSTYEDRVLVPAAMRRALSECSRMKINAIHQENQEVGDLLVQLQRVEGPVTVPFELDSVGLSAENADFLVESGVFARGEDGRYWVAEIYRHGLGFGTERRARVLW
ncbi:KGGVGR-motif variant AAA ATPase [Streptomyces sp. NPDC057654]|uniref:KGGVGR-motif variant AAA ATPase n=1 Tax=Streptomyces sp. NPDC057654 TaxID=3346196 RepID=UPI0036BFBD50